MTQSQFSLMPCTDNLIFAWCNENGKIMEIRKRSGILVKENPQGEYETHYIDETGRVCKNPGYLFPDDAYLPICRENQSFTPQDISMIIERYIQDEGRILQLLEEIEKRGGKAEMPRPNHGDTVKILVEVLPDNVFRFNTQDPFFSFGDELIVHNPFSDAKAETPEEEFTVNTVNRMLHDFRLFYWPGLEVETTFLGEPTEENKKHEAEWKPELDRMIND